MAGQDHPLRVLLVTVELPPPQGAEDQGELVRLAESAGCEVAAEETCRRDAVDPRTYVGSGKVAELRDLIAAQDIGAAIFNSPLTPAQERNLSDELKVEVIDRVTLILRIFAQRARTHEGMLQVELARLRHELTRLVRGWTHLERQKGGFGLRGGPGETQIELDRRAIRERIGAIEGELRQVVRRRHENRKSRRRHEVPVVALVGYTNAGKSTLFNLLTNAGAYAADQLFATLDPTLRALRLKGVGQVILADTVGFIRHLPHELVAAFRATLEETVSADLLLHVVDAADPRRDTHVAAVREVLAELGAEGIPTLLVYNKSDAVEGGMVPLARDGRGLPSRVAVSAHTGAGIAALEDAVAELLGMDAEPLVVRIAPGDYRLRSMLYARGCVRAETALGDGSLRLEAALPRKDAAALDKESGGALGLALEGGVPGWLRPAPKKERYSFADCASGLKIGD
ncbi:MAG: GTPase HflX [Succinivibrionaceae bacterium]|nr:GTPase HflX [Succinivibrionaceae bacterium]